MLKLRVRSSFCCCRCLLSLCSLRANFVAWAINVAKTALFGAHRWTASLQHTVSFLPHPQLFHSHPDRCHYLDLNFHWQEGTQEDPATVRIGSLWELFPVLKTQDSFSHILTSELFLSAIERILSFRFDNPWSASCSLPRPEKHIPGKETKQQNQTPLFLHFPILL